MATRSKPKPTKSSRKSTKSGGKSVPVRKRSSSKTPARPASGRRRSVKPDAPGKVAFPMPRRLVIIGDLNADDDALAVMLRSLGLINQNERWCGRGCHLVQMGDIVNRGSESRAALDRLMDLQEQARRSDGEVTVLLGNHEAMVTLGNEAWCTADEYLEFATDAEQARFDGERSRHIYQLLERASRGGRTESIGGELDAWALRHAPGKQAYRAAWSKDGRYGQFVRSLPLAIRVGPILLTHGGLMPKVAQLGLKEISRQAQRDWERHPETFADLPAQSTLMVEDGPLWCRELALGQGLLVRQQLEESLALTHASTMVVGHTRTDHIPGGQRGVPLAKFDGRLICADVGIGSVTPAAVFVEKGVIWAWRPEEKKKRLCTIPELLDAAPVASVQTDSGKSGTSVQAPAR